MALFNHNAMRTNATQLAALRSLADGHPAGADSTFRALVRRGLVQKTRRWGYILTETGQRMLEAQPENHAFVAYENEPAYCQRCSKHEGRHTGVRS